MFKNLIHYEKLHNFKYPDSKVKIVEKKEGYLYFETEFGLCKKLIGGFGKSDFNIQSAIDKTEYLKNRIIKIYGNKYDYSKVEWKNSVKDKITITCKTHNTEFLKQINAVLTGNLNCPICQKSINKKVRSYDNNEFIKKANLKHNNKYDYNLVNYSGAFNKVEITCFIHGNFWQTPQHHLFGHGCRKCSNLIISTERRKNPTGWSLTDWIKSTEKSKNFDSFKVYIIKCYNENEHFYKIGRTYRTIKKRFEGKIILPYNYTIINVFIGTAKEMLNLETKLKNLNKEHKYLPKIKFNGMYECFSTIKI